MIEKHLVAKNFSKGAKYYDKYADIQRIMAKKLSEFIDEKKKKTKKLQILEVGPGTGIFTEYILERYPNAKIDLIDISSEMLNVCQKKFIKKDQINYILGDIENVSLSKKYDFIFSNASFQWINNFENLFKKLKNSLKEKGKIIFSIFGKDTYIELKKAFMKSNIRNDYSQPFLSEEQLLQYLQSDFEIINMNSEKIYERFDTVMNFLKKIKKLGTNSATKNKNLLTKNKLKSMEKIYLENFSENGKIIVTNHLIYCKVQVK
ncbi:MAG: malonyl-ACP O-methyltransferase BioC [Fusobacteriota bacterium]